jgi:hypothetical protein
MKVQKCQSKPKYKISSFFLELKKMIISKRKKKKKKCDISKDIIIRNKSIIIIHLIVKIFKILRTLKLP